MPLIITDQLLNAWWEFKQETSDNVHGRQNFQMEKVKIINILMNITSFGFIWTDKLNLECILCYEILFNERTQPAEVDRHLQTEHKEYINKPAEYFHKRQLESHAKQEST
jgi:hypothetical protein